MPYIKAEDQHNIAETGDIRNSGELNWMLTLMILSYVEQHGDRYSTYNDVVGALECCKIEFSRRLVAPYEDTKIKENGDVYDGNAFLQRQGASSTEAEEPHSEGPVFYFIPPEDTGDEEEQDEVQP